MDHRPDYHSVLLLRRRKQLERQQLRQWLRRLQQRLLLIQSARSKRHAISPGRQLALRGYFYGPYRKTIMAKYLAGGTPERPVQNAAAGYPPCRRIRGLDLRLPPNA